MHRAPIILIGLALLVRAITSPALGAERSLFNSDGKPVAYIDSDDEPTIYLWAGKPVAYLDEEKYIHLTVAIWGG